MNEDSEIIDGFDTEEDDFNGEELAVKPSLCLSCRRDGDAQEEEMCILTRMDSIEGEEFVCGAYEKLT